MTQEQLEALLGRPLTQVEIDNLDLYIDIAYDALDELLCTDIVEDEDETRTFYVRQGYKTAFIDLFRSVSKVELNGIEVDAADYTKMQWSKFNGSWYNSLVFKDCFGKDDTINVTADWGFDASDIPSDLQMLIAGLFGQISRKNKQDITVQNKKIEDFSVTFNPDADLDDEFYTKYSKTINKYSICNIPNVQHGDLDCGC